MAVCFANFSNIFSFCAPLYKCAYRDKVSIIILNDKKNPQNWGILSLLLEFFEENLGSIRSLGKMLCVTLNTLNSLCSLTESIVEFGVLVSLKLIK